MAEDMPPPEVGADDPAAPPFALPENQPLPEGIHRKYLLSFILTLIVVVLVLGMLPSTAISMVLPEKTALAVGPNPVVNMW